MDINTFLCCAVTLLRWVYDGRTCVSWPPRKSCADGLVASQTSAGVERRLSRAHSCSLTEGATSCMMDCSEEAQCVAEEPAAQLELKKGMSIFIDVSKTIYPDFEGWLHLHDDVLT